MNKKTKIIPSNYFVLILLGILFSAPGLLAYVFYMCPHWLGGAFTNKGVLLTPPILVTDLDLPHLLTPPIKRMKKNLGFPMTPEWQLVLWSPHACDKRCMEQLDKLVRIRLALGRRLYDVTPLLLLGARAPALSEHVAQMLLEQDVTVVRSSFDENAPPLASRGSLEIFIANEDHYLVLSYLPTTKPGDIFHDLNQLLNTTNKVGK